MNGLRPRWRKVLADLWDSKMRTILVVASIAVGVFAVGAIATSFVIISQDIDASYQAVKPANIVIMTDGFDDNLLRSIERIPGITEAEGRYLTSVRVSGDGEIWQSLELVAYDDFDTSRINLLKVFEGTKVPDSHEVLITYDQFNDTGFEAGQQVFLQPDSEVTRQLPVVGIVGDQSQAGDFAAFPRAFVDLDTLEWLGQPVQPNRLYATVDSSLNNDDDLEALAAAVEDKIEKSGRGIYSSRTFNTNEHPSRSIILAMLGVLGALGLLVMLLSSSLIFNTLNALLTQHMRQIGVMKLVGAQSGQISLMYIVLILIFGLIALVIAVPLGTAAGNGLSAFIGDFMSAELGGFRIVPLAIGLQVIVAMVVPLIAGYFPVKRGSNIKVRRALSNDGPATQVTSASLTDRVIGSFSFLTRPLILSIRNTFRRKGRLALTLFTLTMAGAIFIAVFNVRASLEGFMDQLAQHFMADITVNLEEPYRISTVEQAALQVPGVEYVEGWLAAPAELLDADDEAIEDLYIFAPPIDSELIEADVLDGRWIQPGDDHGVVLSDSILTEYPDLKVGDTLRMSVQGKRADDWTVLGFFRFTDMVGATLGYTDYETIANELNLPDQTFSYRMVASGETLEQQQAVSVAVDEHLRAQGFKISDVEAGLVTREENSQGINILVIFLLMMALLTAVVGSIGLAGTMGMNVLERTREIGVMRAIGAVDFDIIQSVVIEGTLIGLISWVLAIIVSFPISYMLLLIIGNAMLNAALPMTFTLLGVGIWLVVVLMLSVVASIIPARGAARLTIREVLAYE